MLTPLEHLDDLVLHLDRVRDACLLLGKRLMNRGELRFGRLVVAAGFSHDVSKFDGIEWDCLHAGEGVAKEDIERAARQHALTNAHHPEHFNGIENMTRLAVAEMVCDWYSRGSEFGTDLRAWINNKAVSRYKIKKRGKQYKWIKEFVDILLENSFTKL